CHSGPPAGMTRYRPGTGGYQEREAIAGTTPAGYARRLSGLLGGSTCLVGICRRLPGRWSWRGRALPVDRLGATAAFLNGPECHPDREDERDHDNADDYEYLPERHVRSSLKWIESQPVAIMPRSVWFLQSEPWRLHR